MIFGRPVYARAILNAVSLASAPPFVKKNTSMSPGVISASFAPRSARGSVENEGCWRFYCGDEPRSRRPIWSEVESDALALFPQ